MIEAELAAGERIFGVLDANNRRVRRNSPMMSSGTSSCRTHRGGTMRRPGCCCSLGSRAAQVYWLAKCHTHLASAIWRKRQSTQPHAHRQHTATLPHRTSPISQTPQYPIISLVDMRQPYTLTTPYYFFHSKLQTSNLQEVATAGRRLRRKGRRRSRRLVARVAMACTTNGTYDVALQRTTAAHRGRLGQRSCLQEWPSVGQP